MPGCKQFASRGRLGRSLHPNPGHTGYHQTCTGSVNRLLMQWLVHQVVDARMEEGFSSWARWTREDPSSHSQQMATTRNGSARSKTYLQFYSTSHPLQPRAIRASTLEDGPAASLSSTTKRSRQHLRLNRKTPGLAPSRDSLPSKRSKERQSNWPVGVMAMDPHE